MEYIWDFILIACAIAFFPCLVYGHRNNPRGHGSPILHPVKGTVCLAVAGFCLILGIVAWLQLLGGNG